MHMVLYCIANLHVYYYKRITKISITTYLRIWKLTILEYNIPHVSFLERTKISYRDNWLT